MSSKQEEYFLFQQIHSWHLSFTMMIILYYLLYVIIYLLFIRQVCLAIATVLTVVVSLPCEKQQLLFHRIVW